MKKGIIAVLVILVVAVAGLPIINGILMEKGFRRLVENANTMYAESGTDTKMEIVRYDRGLLETEVEWKIDLGSMKAIYQIDEVVFVDRAKHGYNGVVSVTSLEKNKWYTDFVSEKLGGQEPVSMTTAYMLSGDIAFTLSLKPFSVEVEGETLSSKPGEIVVTTDWDLTSFDTRGSWQGLNAAGQVEVADITFEANMKLISTYLWEGDVMIAVGSMRAMDQDVNVGMEQLTLEQSLTFDEANNRLAMEVTYGVGSITDGEDNVEDGRVTLGLRGIDAAAYEEAMKVYVELVADIVDEIGEAADDEEKMMELLSEQIESASLQMMGLVEKFLKSDLEIYVKNLHAKFPQGEVDGNVLIRLEKDATLAQMVPMLNSPQMIFDYLSFSSDVKLPIELIGENPMFTSPIYPGMQTGLFLVDGPSFTHKAETIDKKLFINGHEVPLN